MKKRIHSYIAIITLVAVLAGAGCLGPVETNTTANITGEPTPEPCETCSVPEGFCGPPSVCPGEPVNGTYAFTDKNRYSIGDVVEFGIINCGNASVGFGDPAPWRVERQVTNASGCTWELVGNAGCVPAVYCYLDPGESWTKRWDTSGTNRSETIYMVADNLTPGTHRIRYGGDYTKEFEFM